jgi:2Fe-2S ferredoxin
MPKLIVVTRDGTKIPLDGRPGLSIMENIRFAGVDELLAICGGCCSCATCHIYVDPQGPLVERVMSQDETEILESSAHRRSNSRLSCQIPFSEELDGLTVTIAPEDY